MEKYKFFFKNLLILLIFAAILCQFSVRITMKSLKKVLFSVWQCTDLHRFEPNFCLHVSLHRVNHYAKFLFVDPVQQGQYSCSGRWHHFLLHLLALLFYGCVGIQDHSFHQNCLGKNKRETKCAKKSALILYLHEKKTQCLEEFQCLEFFKSIFNNI